MSNLLLRMGKPDEAEKMLAMCPSLKDFTDDTFLQTGNHRFSGNMVLLSRMRLDQGRPDEAMRLASKALTFRQTLLANRLNDIEIFVQLIAIAQTLNEGEGQLARANYKLAILYNHKGMEAESQICKDRAIALRANLRPEAKDAPYEEAEFMKLCL
ncbi:hypothetical protein BU16DRAFT_623622 [Lophium mytilinum]|uniref:MalT-like TPR region domain-containing protein n=1 Tax=Lophium mytilinum TaxID=390894 RepID=A0A6A6Q8E8_9PEZI|nr:hypothetical protein BU16DRAFT_623622 [Lophium mytilinum]